MLAMRFKFILFFLVLNAMLMLAFGATVRSVLLVTATWVLGFLLKWWEVRTFPEG
jgi:hypothetical protein